MILKGLLLTLIIAGCVFGSIAQFSESDIIGSHNEIRNSGFEEVTDAENLPGWTLLNEDASVSIVHNEFNSGLASVQINRPEQKVRLISDSFPIDPESIYLNRFYLKNNYLSNHQVQVDFIAFDAAGKKVNNFKINVTPDNIWSKFTFNTGFFKPKARFARIMITFPARDDKIYWLDDVESFRIYRFQK